MYAFRTLPILVLAAFMACNPSLPPNETWRGSAIIADGRQIPFVLHLDTESTPPSADFLISDERTPVPEVVLNGDSVHLIIAEYDAAFRLVWDGTQLRGRYERYRSDTTGFEVSAAPFVPPADAQPPPPSHPLSGAFTVFRPTRGGSDSSNSAVFWTRGDSVFGTIVAPSGDDGLFAGTQSGDTVRLARFTGWQSLFLELVRKDDTWEGLRFMRENSPSSFSLRPRVESIDGGDHALETRLRKGLRHFTFEGVTPEGDTVTSSDERFRGKALIVDIMGTWCHNCLDGAPILQNIYEEYRSEGLEIVSLAFELRDDLRSGLRNIRIFSERHDLTFTMLYCGDLSEQNVEQRITQQLENFGAYPTALFIDKNGTVVDIHEGFKGPGTGAGYQEEIDHFNRMAKLLTQR